MVGGGVSWVDRAPFHLIHRHSPCVNILPPFPLLLGSSIVPVNEAEFPTI